MNWEDALWGLEQIVPRCRDVRGHMWNFSRGYAGCMRCDVVRGGMGMLEAAGIHMTSLNGQNWQELYDCFKGRP